MNLPSWFDRCICCKRPIHDSGDPADPLARRIQASGAYALCARCEDVARAEAGEPAHADEATP